MPKLFSLTPRQYLIVAHDLLATAVAIVASFFIRFEETGLAERFDGLMRSCRASWSMRASSISCSGCTPRSGASPRCPTCATSCAPRRCSRSRCWCSTTSWCRRRSTARSSSARSRSSSTGSCRWRFSPDRASPTAISAMRARSSMRAASDCGADAACSGARPTPRCCLRAIESGAVSRIRPVGILSPSLADRGQSMRGIPVVGSLDDLEQVVRDSEARGTHIARLIFTPSALVPEVGAGIDPDARAPARAADEPAAGADRGRRGAAACAGRGRGPAAAAERDDRLSAARAVRARQVDHRDRRRRLDRRGDLRPRRDVRRRAAAGRGEFRAGAAHGPRSAARQGRERRDRGPHRGRARPRAHHARVRRFQARHRVPCGGAEARAAARTRLGRGHQDQRVRLGQCRRRGGRGRRRRDGDDLDRQGDRAGLGARRDQAARRDVCQALDADFARRAARAAARCG